ncbi:hypothetical protein QLR68_10125 [Micromonospora sp. DH15]|nr:hypothetical protein [Micromonospora sp. DH15]
MRPRVAMVFAVAAILLGSAMLVPAAYAKLSGDDDGGSGGSGMQIVAAPEPTAPPPPTLAAAPVSVNFSGEFFSWALLDRESGSISGSKNLASTSSTESMIKAWIVADYLRQLGDKEPSPRMKQMASLAIRDSNDGAADAVWGAAGGSYRVYPNGQLNPVLKRAVDICGLTDTKRGNVAGYVGYWSFTRMSPRDAVRLGDCIASGKAAGPEWTKWLINEMRLVRGSGDFGIRKAFPAAEQKKIAIKNGWIDRTREQEMHINCLAIGDNWTMGVMVRYPINMGYEYGMKNCQKITEAVLRSGT